MKQPTASTTGEKTATRDNCLALEHFNAVIVGNGAIGSALLEQLVQMPGLQHALVLGRNNAATVKHPKVTPLKFAAEEPGSIVAAAGEARQIVDRAHLLINTVGILHRGEQRPEKRLRDLDPDHLHTAFTINAALLPALAQQFGDLLRHPEPALLASLSARVGSIEDNQLGGWYSYRASKAAHNMLLKTLSQEWRVSHRNVTVVALHPGTVRSRLSEPFLASGYKNRVLTPPECAQALLAVVGELRHEHSGSFYDWQGKSIPW